jgi:hypothetical protein
MEMFTCNSFNKACWFLLTGPVTLLFTDHIGLFDRIRGNKRGNPLCMRGMFWYFTVSSKVNNIT